MQQTGYRREQQPLRVAMLSVHTCPLALLGGKKTGGMNVYVRDLSRELGRHGVHVDVFTRSQDECQPQIKHDLGFGGRVIHIPAGPQTPIPVAEVQDYLPEFTEGILSFAREEGLPYDIIHSHYWLSGLVAEKLKEAWGRQVPILQMFHTLGHMKNRIATFDDQRASQERIDGEFHIIHNVADRIIAATLAEQAQLRWLYQAPQEKIAIIPPGVDLSRFQPIPQHEAITNIALPTDRKTIIFAGRIEPLKGIDTLLEAIKLVQDCCPETVKEVSVGIIGGDPQAENPVAEMARLKSLRVELGLEELVTFLGAKDQSALPDYYAAAEMVVMPSHYESFGLVALEAMAMGTPVIASEVGGLAFLVRDGETGFHVPSHDPQALADRIRCLLKDKALRDQMGLNARRHAERYAWSNIVVKMLALYRGLAPERPQPP
ncbi:MAG: glycosyltransferase, partial [Anaerolineales bacterium]|nr:glycosyltransferase [Anaerolineales bacterium]